MKRPSIRLVPLLTRLTLVTLLTMLVAPAVSADRLHLDGGGTIDTDHWWLEGDWLYYDDREGTVGIPRSLVVRIEEQPNPDRRPREVRETMPATNELSRRRASEREELIKAGRDALESGDYDGAAVAFRDALDLDSGHPVAAVGYAMTQIALGRDGIALSVVQDALVRNPNRAELHELLGDLRNREERVQDALEAWQRSFDLAPKDRVREKIVKAQRELAAGRDFEFANTSHFTVRYDGDVAQNLAADVMDHLESSYRELSDRFRHAPPQPITVILYETREFREVTQAAEWVGGLYDGKIRVPLGGLRRLNGRARAVLDHELTHAILHSKSRGHCPRWLHEGLAQIIEGRTVSRADVASVREHLSAGDPGDWESRGFSYPLALSLASFLEDYRGFDNLVWLVERLGEGAELDGVLREIYGYDHAGICRVWARSLSEESRD